MFRFINRSEELSFLENKFNASTSQFIVLYGRRRVGKTELIKQFCKEKKALYLLADKRGTILNIIRFSEKAAEYFDDITPKPENFYDFFRYLNKQIGDDRFILVIDEFSYLIERDDTIPSVFQVIWDEHLKNRNIMLILCGSSVSMMIEGVLSQKSPLYGRRTGQWKVDPMSASQIRELHEGLDMKTAIEFYSVLGGIPLYVLEFDRKNTVFENIALHIIRKGEILYEEVETLLKEELREYYLYLSIFEAIAKGKTRVVEIADYSRISAKDLPKYLNTLQRLELIGKEHPVTEKDRSKKTQYFIRDNLFSFYFRYIYPNKGYIESGSTDEVIEKIKVDFNNYTGKCFENVVRDHLVVLNHAKKLPFVFNSIGRQWGKIPARPRGKNMYEIDIAALDNKTKQILFIECKWKNLKEEQALDILIDLRLKAASVQWNNDSRAEYFGLVAKHIEGKERLQNKGFVVLDLDDF